MDCKKELNKGVPIFDEDYDHEKAFYFKVKCPEWNGKYLRIEHKSDTDYSSPVEAPDYKSPITDDGTYVFLFDQNANFWNTKVDNLFEYGQIHYTLVFASKVYESKIKRVLAGGEIRKKGTLLEFNLQSGTFMAEWLVEDLNNQCTDDLVKLVTQRLKEIHPSFEIVYNKETFIHDKSLKLETTFLDKLYRAGFVIRMYKDKNVCLLNPEEARKSSREDYWKRMLHLFENEYELYKPKQGGKTRRRKSRSKRTKKSH